MASIYWVNLTNLILSFSHYSIGNLLSLLFITFRWWVRCHKVLNFVYLSLFQQYIFEYIHIGHITVFINITKNEHCTRFLYGELMSIKFCGCGNLQWFLTVCLLEQVTLYPSTFVFKSSKYKFISLIGFTWLIYNFEKHNHRQVPF